MLIVMDNSKISNTAVECERLVVVKDAINV